MPRIYGASPKRKLTDEQVAEIRTLAGRITNRTLAIQYGVSKNTIAGILRGEVYKVATTDPKPSKYGCGHPRIAGNTYVMAGLERCQLCHRASLRASRKREATQRVVYQRPKKVRKPDFSHDPAVQLYRQEKARWLAKHARAA